MKNWIDNEECIRDTVNLAQNTLISIAKLADQHHIPFADVGEYTDVFIKCIYVVMEDVLLDMLKNRIDNSDIKENYDIPEDC